MRCRLALLTVLAMAALAPAAGAETVPLPADAATGSSQNDLIYQMSCAAAGYCVGVGAYHDTSADNQALIEMQADGSWSASKIPDSSLPNAGPTPLPYLTSVACTSVGNCVAADAYDDKNGDEQGLIDTEADGLWTPSAAPLTGLSVYSNPGVEVFDLSCPAAGACVGIGNYGDNNDSLEGLIETQSQSGWSPTQAPWPSASNEASFAPTLYDIACASAGNCAAVGYYTDSSQDQQGLLETDDGRAWSAGELDLSQLETAANPQASLFGVSCPSAGNCTAAGTYVDATGAYRGLAVSQVNGVWQPATAVNLPSDASTVAVGGNPVQNDLYLNDVSCSSAGNCTAVGSYDATSSNDVEGLELTESGGSWSQGNEATAPDGAATNPLASLDSVTCQSAADCLAAGTYVQSDGDNATLVDRETAGGWTSAGLGLPTPYDSGLSTQYWASVACSAGGYCATGGYAADNSSGLDTAFVFDAPGAPAGIAATRDGDQATVSWSAPGDGGGLPLSGFTVTADDQSDAAGDQTLPVSAATTTATVAALRPGDTYTFTVAAVSLLGTGVPATSAAVAVPPAPTQSTPTQTTPTQTTPTQTETTPTSTGPPASASRAEIVASLARLLKPSGASARLVRLRRTHDYVFRYRALEPGRVSVRWYRSGRGRLLAGSGMARAAAGKSVTITLRLTGAGRRLVRSSRRLRLQAVVSFTHGAATVSRSTRFTLS